MFIRNNCNNAKNHEDTSQRLMFKHQTLRSRFPVPVTYVMGCWCKTGGFK